MHQNYDITPRSTLMAEMFVSGNTLQHIGDLHGICRERVRQLLIPHNLTRSDGGQCVSGARNAKKKNKLTNAKFKKNFGCTLNQWRELLKIKGRPTRKYTQQRNNALRRGVKWQFNLWTWWCVWRDSGKWLMRGRMRENYVMARYGDEGPYSAENVSIITMLKNCQEIQYNLRIKCLHKRSNKD